MDNFESNEIHIRAMIISDYSHRHNHWASVKSLSDWLKEYNVPGIYGLDTRAITKKIREEGVMLGRLTFGDQPVPNFVDPNDSNIIAEVSLKEPKLYGPDGPENPRVIVVDVGVKNNIVRCLVERGARVKVVPWDYDFNKDEYDGLFISNGPGAPWMAGKTIEYMRVAMNNPDPKPIMGICLGNQLMALASGAKTYKMQFGNRAQNVPCIDQETYRCYITPQNHGYAVDNRTLSPEWRPYFINANDGSNEGIKHLSKPFFAVQFHPEAEGGPYDTSYLFDHFLANAKKYQAEHPRERRATA
jgi:carbamoyl-phosphate synthase small subunit